MPTGERFTITDLAREFDVTTRTIRFYEDEGLLSPERHGQARVYAPRDRVRLRLILRGKRLGFSLSEIKEIFDLYDSAPGEAGQLRHFLAKIAERRRQLGQQREDIEVTLAELDTVEARCHARLAELEGATGRARGRAKRRP
jgi:DNA-binding transcriptional MerR regulator